MVFLKVFIDILLKLVPGAFSRALYVHPKTVSRSRRYPCFADRARKQKYAGYPPAA